MCASQPFFMCIVKMWFCVTNKKNYLQDKSSPKVNVNDYIQIYGNVKTNKGKKVVMIFKIMPITDVNAITFHYLQCINNKVKMEADSKKVSKCKLSIRGYLVIILYVA